MVGLSIGGMAPLRRPLTMPVSSNKVPPTRFGQLNTWHYRVSNILEASITVPGLKHPLTVISPLANPTQGWLDITLSSSEAFGQALVPRRGFPLAELKPHGFNSYDDIFVQLYRKPDQHRPPVRRRQQEPVRHSTGLLDFPPIPEDDPVYTPLKTDLRELCDTFEASRHWGRTDPTEDYRPDSDPPPPSSPDRRGRRGKRP